MSALGTSTLALALVYVVIGAHTLMLAQPRRADRVVRSFGMVCISMAGFSLQSTLLSEATTVEQARFGQSVELICAAMAVGFYLDFCRELRGSTSRFILVLSIGLPALALGLACLGTLTEPVAVPLRQDARLSLWNRPTLLLAERPTIGHVLEIVLGLGVALAAYLAYTGEDRQQLRPTILAPCAIVLSVCHDLLAEAAQISTLFLSEYAFLVMALAGSQRVIARSRRVADALEERTAALQEGSAVLEQTKEEAVRREQAAAIGKLSTIVAHELRNPLMIISHAATSLAKWRSSEQGYYELVDVIDEETDRLDRLVGDVLAYTQPLDLRLETVDVESLLQTVSRRWRRSDPPGVQVQLHIIVRPRGARFVVDADLLCQALQNVIDNACHAMPRGGVIMVSASEGTLDGRPATVLQISDDGPGMPRAVVRRARELFFTTRPDGTGLGLAIVERVVRAHRGKLEIESAPGSGTTIRFHLPNAALATAVTSPPAPEPVVERAL